MWSERRPATCTSASVPQARWHFKTSLVPQVRTKRRLRRHLRRSLRLRRRARLGKRRIRGARGIRRATPALVALNRAPRLMSAAPPTVRSSIVIMRVRNRSRRSIQRRASARVGAPTQRIRRRRSRSYRHASRAKKPATSCAAGGRPGAWATNTIRMHRPTPRISDMIPAVDRRERKAPRFRS